jgi:hypothetical protein
LTPFVDGFARLSPTDDFAARLYITAQGDAVPGRGAIPYFINDPGEEKPK